MTSYARVLLDGKAGTIAFEFPALGIYDKAGKLIYFSSVEKNNLRAIHDLAHGSFHGGMTANGPTLDQLFAASPALREQAGSVRRGRATVLSLTLENCGSCLRQTAALADVGSALQRRGVSTLEWELTQ
jgi:hypothetical protein